MACQAIHYWTFSGLVGAFLDLAIAYLLLCASTFAFFASKFLDIFGLCLPCPCNGLFGNPNGNYCAQRLLLDCPIGQITSVQFSAKSKFPFDSVFAKDQNLDSNMKLIGDGNHNVDGFVEFEEGSCSSILDVSKSQTVVGKELVDRVENGVMSSQGVTKRRLDGKGKRVINERPKGVIRRRRKGVVVDDGRLSSESARDLICVDPQGFSQPISSINEEQKEAIQDEGERAFVDFQLSQPPVKTKPNELNGDNENIIRVLKEKLEEEHAARAALYLELEEERNAAATAADEAMAMILRLQEEKASIEMEARQYQRMIEEKAAYDAEEMNILKEILLRRETEKHFLEKEVETYRQMNYLRNEEFEGDYRDLHRRLFDSSLDLSEDPSLMLHQLSESIDKKERFKDRYLSNPIQGWDEHANNSKQGNLEREFSHVLKYISDCNQELHEKKMISADNNPHPQPNEVQILEASLSSYGSSSQEHNFPIVSEKQGETSQSLVSEEEVRVHDVHVIGEKQGQNGQNGQSSPSTSTLDTEMNTGHHPPTGPRGISVISDPWRNSTSALDDERSKIDSEVAWLRERLRLVQEGREKLNLGVEYREREKLQLQLLEDIVIQLQEIRQCTTEPQKARQVSLPLPCSKVMSQKKRCRSASLGLDKSS